METSQRWIAEGTTADAYALQCRQAIAELYAKAPLSAENMQYNLGLFVKTPLLTKFLLLHEVYERVKHLPGALMEFGVWYGQNLVLLENLRAIHEPFNKQREIVGFDTFSGYTPLSDRDRPTSVLIDDTYTTPPDYVAYLSDLLEAHAGANALGHVPARHVLVAGDVTESVPRFFRDNPETLVAFAYFDIGTYAPTKAILQALLPHVMPGTILLFDELTWPGAPGEAIAFKEVMHGRPYQIEKCRLFPAKALVTIQ